VPVARDEWLGLMAREYLADHVRHGGGAVRVAVAAEAALAGLRGELERQGIDAGFDTVAIDAAETKIQQLQLVFFAVARAIDWDALAQARLEALVAEAGYAWPQPGARVSMVVLAEANGVAAPLLRRELVGLLSRRVWGDRALAQDFRRAMVALLDARLSDDKDGLRDAVRDWLRGDLRTLRPVKEAGIGARITLQSARAMLVSLCHWLRACGRPGLVVVLDITRLLRDRREVADGIAYTPAAVMAAYEVIRQVIDDTEHFPGLFLAVLADLRLIDDSVPKRGLAAYDALRLRLSNDVRPRARDNPLAPLVVLAA
jgi:hypothetical protein